MFLNMRRILHNSEDFFVYSYSVGFVVQISYVAIAFQARRKHTVSSDFKSSLANL